MNGNYVIRYKTFENDEWVYEQDGGIENPNINELEFVDFDEEYFTCYDTNIETLILPENLTYLQASKNRIRTLTPNQKLEVLLCISNLLKSIPITHPLIELQSDNVFLTGKSDCDNFIINFEC